MPQSALSLVIVIVGMPLASVSGRFSILVTVVAMLAGAWLHGEPLGAPQRAAMACAGG